ncbi:MAG TPA: DUF5924 family protein [Thermoanaerobaculia bacterium]|nr:DUF5924 family protein [Thermoanaerobaculia bacterium]
MKWREFHEKYARLFWALHSAWALISGIAVLVLAHNRYGFLRWVVLFIALTWGSTLFFSRIAIDESSRALRFAQSVVSYLMRVMYQETLFFLIPFYFYSATFPSWNFLYVIALAALAVLSCFDLLFDRLLREHRWFSTSFFAFVSFSALQFFLPLLLRTRIDNSEYLAAAISFLAALALARRLGDLRERRRLIAIAIAFAAVLIGVRVFRPLLPPVPLRMTRLRISGALNPRTLEAPRDFEQEIPASELRRGRIYAVATVFSPQRIPVRLQMRFIENGKVLRQSRNLDLTARPGGFRIWDSVKPVGNNASIRIEVWSAGQLLGKRTVRVVDGARTSRPQSLGVSPGDYFVIGRDARSLRAGMPALR